MTEYGAENEVVRDLAFTSTDPHIPTDTTGLLIFNTPDGPQTVDVSKWLETPVRSKAGRRVVRDEDSFIALVQRFGHGSDAIVFADTDTYDVEAVLDEDTDELNPNWREHRVVLDLIVTDEWREWVENDGKLMTQTQFAEFIELHLDNIAEPTAADMLELAQSLSATMDGRFESRVRLQSGQRHFVYSENITPQAGTNGELEVPDQFTLGLTPWQSRPGAPFRVTAKLRYRIENGQLRLGWKLVDHMRILDAAFLNDIVKPIKDGLTGSAVVVYGKP